MTDTHPLTKGGKRSRAVIREGIVRMMGTRAGARLTRREVAAAVGIGMRTLRDYLTPDLVAEIDAARRDEVSASDWEAIVNALIDQAKQGSVPAAKLLHERALRHTEGAPADEPPMSWAELADLVARMAAQHQPTKETTHGILDDAADVDTKPSGRTAQP